jgi:predicted short-subunit dehydrogenase-like oxidoreductase (DUF2520 family)
MNIVFIGSGNVTAILGRKFVAAGHKIAQIYSRNASAASELAYEWDSESTNYISMIVKHADVYIISVSDASIASLAKELHLQGKVVAHTAGAVSKDVLQTVTEDYGIFYPLQTLRKESPHLPDTPIFVDAATEKAKLVLDSLAASISHNHEVHHATELQREKLHVTAVVVNNLVNHLYTLVEAFCKAEGVDFKQLLPLIQETTERVNSSSPALVQTGPAIRHDEVTLNKHMALLNNYPQLQKIYKTISDSIEGKTV